MTKTIGLVLAASLIACTADPGETAPAAVNLPSAADAPAVPPAEVGSASTPSGDSAAPCPTETEAAPIKTPGILENCTGDFECNGGRRYGGKEASLHTDGITCRLAENPGDDLTFEADGRVTLGGKNIGTWFGDSVAFTYTRDYGNGPVDFDCRPQPASAK